MNVASQEKAAHPGAITPGDVKPQAHNHRRLWHLLVLLDGQHPAAQRAEAGVSVAM